VAVSLSHLWGRHPFFYHAETHRKTNTVSIEQSTNWTITYRLRRGLGPQWDVRSLELVLEEPADEIAAIQHFETEMSSRDDFPLYGRHWRLMMTVPIHRT